MGLLACVLIVLAVPAIGQNMFSNMIVLNNGNYNISWNFNSSSDTVDFLVEAKTTGWVGFGLAVIAPNNMLNYDVAVGGVLSNGTGYLKVNKRFL